MKKIKIVETLPLVSVIMPTYNHAKFIGNAIESVLGQSYKNLELIIVDNYSEDDTEEIVTSFADKRIKYLKFKNHGIIAASRNYGIKNSQGKYIAFLDSDDMWHHFKLEKQLQYFCDKEIVGVGTDAILISDTPFYRQEYHPRSTNGYVDYDYYSILNSNPIITSSVIVRRDILSVVGGFDEDPDFRFIEDWQLWLRMARLGKFRILGGQLVYYRVFTDKDRDRVDVAKRVLKIFEKQLDLGYVTEKDIKEARAGVNLLIARRLLDSGDPVCRRYYFAAFKDSSIFKRKLKTSLGYFLSLQPPVLQRILRYGWDWIWQIKKGSYSSK